MKKPKIDDATDDLTSKLKGKWINVDEPLGFQASHLRAQG